MEEQVFAYPYGILNQFEGKRAYKDYIIAKEDEAILRELAEKKAEIAQKSVQGKKIDLWKKLNDLEDTRPLLWINELPWHELNVDGELHTKTKTPFSKFLETRLKRTLYCWKHIPVDMVVEPTLPCYVVIESTGFGISEEVDIAITDVESEVVSREFTQQIKDEEDLEKIKLPRIDYKEKETKKKYQVMKNLFDGILDVEKTGIPGFWFSPWDELIRWWGVQEALTDLVLRPRFVHKVMEKLTDAYLYMLSQYEDKNLLALNNGNYRAGSGGLGFTDKLPQKDFDPSRIRTQDLWGSGAAQIFSDVSPDMHYEFALSYEIKWMEKFGLNYYGCCEPLDRKIDLLKKIPNLRKISISPWADLDSAIEKMGKDYVISYKPNPAIFTADNWDPKNIRIELQKTFEKFRGYRVEVILKDISTVKYKPQRLWEWAKIATEVAKEL